MTDAGGQQLGYSNDDQQGGYQNTGYDMGWQGKGDSHAISSHQEPESHSGHTGIGIKEDG